MKNQIKFNGKEYQLEIFNGRLEVSVKVENFTMTPWRRMFATSAIEKAELAETILDEVGMRNSEAQAFAEAIVTAIKA